MALFMICISVCLKPTFHAVIYHSQEFLAYTNKPVTLEDIISIKGKSLTVAMQPQQDATHDFDKVAVDYKASTARRTPATPCLLKSAGKKKVMFLSEWPQNKVDFETNLTFKRLAEVRTSIYNTVYARNTMTAVYFLEICNTRNVI